jgi:hypothetical protein
VFDLSITATAMVIGIECYELHGVFLSSKKRKGVYIRMFCATIVLALIVLKIINYMKMDSLLAQEIAISTIWIFLCFCFILQFCRLSKKIASSGAVVVTPVTEADDPVQHHHSSSHTTTTKQSILRKPSPSRKVNEVDKVKLNAINDTTGGVSALSDRNKTQKAARKLLYFSRLISIAAGGGLSLFIAGLVVVDMKNKKYLFSSALLFLHLWTIS